MSFNTESSGKRSRQFTGASLGKDPEALRRIVRIVKESVHVPILVKITPEGGRIAESAQACVEAGADAVGERQTDLVFLTLIYIILWEQSTGFRVILLWDACQDHGSDHWHCGIYTK